MKYRRYHITKNEAELILKCIPCALDDIRQIQKYDDSPYFKWLKTEIEILQENLKKYNWEA